MSFQAASTWILIPTKSTKPETVSPGFGSSCLSEVSSAELPFDVSGETSRSYKRAFVFIAICSGLDFYLPKS
jgi:hypothetical protein